ncbi:hypothetical protein Dsin_015721 [Dipteronia sinensis]|uniref:Growth-regulating factor n=1 Tax=Dipteronia sinensis TaxID=43782 RepID=A0AAE0AD38_9ROSI|nr:hypothetical protein Dsin_015721 [Dipteronia sinensis]
MPRTGNKIPVSGTMPLQLQGMTPLLRPNYMVSSNNTAARQQQMLSFSSKIYTPSSSAYTIAGYGYRSSNPGMHVPYSRIRGNFTQSQLNELNRQLWMMTHITVNVPLRSRLLNYLYGSKGTFYVGSGSNDSEPGRCRRTDGKKWRCSRKVAPQQKFCREHKHRAQAHYRSRKLLEGPTHQAPTGPTSSMSTSTSGGASTMQPVAAIPSSSMSTCGGASTKQPCITIPSANVIVIRENHVFDKAEEQPHSLCPLVPGLGSSDSHSSFLLNTESNVDEFFIDLTSSDDNQESQDQESHHNSKIEIEEFFIDLTLSDEESLHKSNDEQISAPEPKDELESPVINWPDNFETEWTQFTKFYFDNK